MSKQKAGLLLLLVIGGITSYLAHAKSTVPNTPSEAFKYEQSLQGWIRVNATIFNAPCNLMTNKAVFLTGCGAGTVFRTKDLLSNTANTPAILAFYDVKKEQVIQHFPISLRNGNNKIILPILGKEQHLLRLEVSYE